jgi:hypothetical protein
MLSSTGLRLAAVSAAVLAFLVACSDDDHTSAASPSPATPVTTASAGVGAAPTSTLGSHGAGPGTGTSPGGKGCTPNGERVPAGATQATYADVDGDAKRDTVFLDSTGSRVGIRTASGRVFSIGYRVAEASELSAQAFVTADGNALILLSGSRQAYLFGIVNCAVVVTRNAEGDQYTFDNGFKDLDTGVGCLSGSDQTLTLAGLRAAKMGMSSGYYEVYRTAITIGERGRSASNGPITQSDENVSHDRARAKVRTGFPCVPPSGIAKA